MPDLRRESNPRFTLLEDLSYPFLLQKEWQQNRSLGSAIGQHTLSERVGCELDSCSSSKVLRIIVHHLRNGILTFRLRTTAQLLKIFLQTLYCTMETCGVPNKFWPRDNSYKLVNRLGLCQINIRERQILNIFCYVTKNTSKDGNIRTH